MPVFSPEEVIETFEMIRLLHLNVRTVTLGISLLDCASRDLGSIKEAVYRRVTEAAKRLVKEAEEVERIYGVPIVNKRLAVTPVSLLLNSSTKGMSLEEAVKEAIKIAEVLDKAAESVGVDFVGGFGALVHKGVEWGDKVLIESIPRALSATERVCSCVNVADTKSGVNVDVVLKMGHVVKETAEMTADKSGVGCAKLVVYANAPEDNPFMAGAFHGIGQAELVLNVGISGPNVIRNVVVKAGDVGLRELAELVKRAAFKITRVGELVGREVAKRLGVKFGAVDLSLAPTPEEGESVAEIIEAIGVDRCGAPGSTAALALLVDAIKKGGCMATSMVGGVSGAFIPVSEDAGMSRAARLGALSIEKLEAMTAVCSAGLDMIAIPGDTHPETIAAIILDEMAIGVVNDKPVGVRLIPVPGKKAGDEVEFGGLFGKTVVMQVSELGASKLLRRGGQLPPPILSLRG